MRVFGALVDNATQIKTVQWGVAGLSAALRKASICRCRSASVVAGKQAFLGNIDPVGYSRSHCCSPVAFVELVGGASAQPTKRIRAVVNAIERIMCSPFLSEFQCANPLLQDVNDCVNCKPDPQHG